LNSIFVKTKISPQSPQTKGSSLGPVTTVGYDFRVSMADIRFRHIAHKQCTNTIAKFMHLIKNENEIYFP